MNADTIREFLRRKPFEPFVIRMSNGVEGRRGATGWISFSNGLVVRREQGRWRFSGGLICAATAADRGECR